MAGQPTPAVPYLRGARAVKVTDEKGGQNKWSNGWSKLLVKRVVKISEKKVVKIEVKISGHKGGQTSCQKGGQN